MVSKITLLFYSLLLIFPLSLAAQGIRYEANVTVPSKQVPPGAQAPVYTLPYAQITVCAMPGTPVGDVCTNQVPIYSDATLTQQINQPFQADSQGRFVFFAPSGSYDYSVQNQQGTYEGTYGANLPNTAAFPTLAKVATTGQYADLLNAPVVSILGFPGADACQKLVAADAEYAGQAITFDVPGGNCASRVTLNTLHSLRLSGPLTLTGAGAITPTSYNNISCLGSGQFINGGMNVYAGNAINPIIYVPAAATSASHLRISGCQVEGGSFATLYYTLYNTTDVQIDHNSLHNGSLFVQEGALPFNPTTRVDISDNSVNVDQGNATALYAVTAYGATQDSTIHHNIVNGSHGGVELFATSQDVNGNYVPGSANPPYAQIVSGGLKNVTVSDNVFTNLQQTNSSVFTSTASHILVANNNSENGVDVDYDFEATVDSEQIGNTSKNNPTACFGGFYTQYNNLYEGNHCINSIGFSFQNAGGYPYIVSNITVRNNEYVSTSGIGIFAYLHASQHTIWEGNAVTDGVIARALVFNNSEELNNNTFHFTRTLPSSGIGDNQAPGFGLFVGNNNDSSYNNALNNHLVTDVAQSNACISAGLSFSNPPNPISRINGNECIGPWSTSVLVSSGSTNTSVNPLFEVRNNELRGCTIQGTSSTGVQPVIYKSGNYDSLTGQTCN